MFYSTLAYNCVVNQVSIMNVEQLFVNIMFSYLDPLVKM